MNPGRRSNPPPCPCPGDAMAVLKLFDRFVALLASIVRLVCIVLTIALFTIVVVAIVARYGFGQAVSWTEEVPRYLLIWISFLAAASCVLRREHVGFDVLFNSLPKGPRKALGVFLGLLIFGFGWVVFRYGIVFVQDFGGDLMETISYTNYWYYPAMPISGFLMMVFSIKLIIDEIIKADAGAISGSSVETVGMGENRP
jgi:TRAP-type transport system small permease protein